MGKVKTLKKQKKSSTRSKVPILYEHDPFSKELADPKLIKLTILQALMVSDLEAVRDVLVAHLQTINKSNLALKTKLGRQTIYDLMDSKKEFNPSLKTFSVILDNIAA